jgi:hypothetical protein
MLTKAMPPNLMPLKPHAQAGQALVETLVAAIVLLPLLLLAIYLGKLQTVQQSTLAASRSLAFECQVSLDACAKMTGPTATSTELGDELRRRHFMRSSVGINSNEFASDSANASERQGLWKDHRSNTLLESYADIGFRVDPDTFNAGSGIVGGTGSKIANNAMDLVSNIAGPARFGLDWQGGLIDAKVQAQLSKSNPVNALVASLDAMPLTMRSHTAILTNAWNASSPDGSEASSTKSRVDQGKRLPLIESVIDAMYLPTQLLIQFAEGAKLESNGSAFKYHEVDVKKIPADRLPGYTPSIPAPVDGNSGSTDNGG